MKNKSKPVYSYDYEQQERKYELIIARLYGFSLGVIVSAVLTSIIIFERW